MYVLRYRIPTGNHELYKSLFTYLNNLIIFIIIKTVSNFKIIVPGLETKKKCFKSM